MKNLINGNQENFQKLLEENEILLVDFWAEWCGPCRALSPILEELAAGLENQEKIIKINVDENSELAQEYGIRAIPTIIFFKNGQAEKTLTGLNSKEDLKKIIEDLKK